MSPRWEPGEFEEQHRRAGEIAAVVDPLLADVWAFAWTNEKPPEEAGAQEVPLAVMLRMAYLQGYRDALEEPDRGALFVRLGVEVPPLKKQRRPAARARRSPEARDNSGS